MLPYHSTKEGREENDSMENGTENELLFISFFLSKMPAIFSHMWFKLKMFCVSEIQ